MGQLLEEIYGRLLAEFGHRKWWPAETRDEIVIGAILAQSVSWRNVRRAISNLKRMGLLTLQAIHEADANEVATMIKPTRFYNQKTQRLKNFTQFLFDVYGGSLDSMFSEEVNELRKKMLGIRGLGDETVDSIILYAGNKPIFVIDAYTVRIFSRLGLTEEGWSYLQHQQFFMEHLEPSVDHFNDFHAQIVHLGFLYCGKKYPQCEKCPLSSICQHSSHAE